MEKVGRSGITAVGVPGEQPATSTAPLDDQAFIVVAEIPSSWKKAALWVSFAGLAASGPSKPGTPERPSNGRPKTEQTNTRPAQNSWLRVASGTMLTAPIQLQPGETWASLAQLLTTGQRNTKVGIMDSTLRALKAANPQLAGPNGTLLVPTSPVEIGLPKNMAVHPSALTASQPMRTEDAVVEACKQLSAIDHDFGIIVEQKFDSKYWKKTEYATYVPADGVKPSEALRHLLSNKEGYTYECATGLVIALHTAKLLRDGDAAFDREVPDLKIGPWKMSDNMWRKLSRHTGTGGDRLSTEDWKNIPVGSVLYIENPWVTGLGYVSAMQGQNAILCGYDANGEALLWGHPFGIVKESEIVGKLSDSQYWFAENPYYSNSWKVLR